MIRRMSCAGFVAALAIASVAGGADAADLGGNCCADLEERIAELEATTARKGNRKVSLSISGWVAEQVTHWDDGHESNTYVTGLGTALSSNVQFTGQATIAPGWNAGYVIRIEATGSDNVTTSQDTPNGPGVFSGATNSVQAYESYWFLKNDYLGKVSVGLLSPPSDNGVIYLDGSGSIFPANWVISGAYSFRIRDRAGNNIPFGGGNLVWGNTGTCYPGDCLGLPWEAVRYDTPVWKGFSASASWGGDDVWDIGLRYSGEHHGFKVAFAGFYGEDRDPLNASASSNADFYQLGLYVQHVDTGLFGLVNYGSIDDERRRAGLEPDTLYVKGGIRTNRLTSLGATVPYVEYITSKDGTSRGSEFELWGAGVVQEIDSAAMSLFAKYRNYSFEDGALCANGCEDFDELSVGGVIMF